LDIAIFVVQHMPEKFTKSFAERLDKISDIRVKEAEEGDVVCSGTCYLAKGGWHMEIRQECFVGSIRNVIHLSLDPKENGFRPSVDFTMRSVAALYGDKSIGVVLTGMGHDGALGIKAIKDAGGGTAVQSPETAVINSMPQAAIDTGCVDEQLDPGGISDLIIEHSQVRI
jgi:two-component system, chemotaxis family, protein-glutamate methylesterase/glutaminase